MSMCTWGVGLGVTMALLASGRLHAAQDGKMKFEIYQDNAKEYRWRLKAANGQTLATSGQGYKAKADCKRGVDLVKAEAATDKLKFELYEDKGKEHRWRLKSSNGQTVAAASEGYKARADLEKAIDSIKKGVATATVEEK
jgi:uncharacterized protein YegP (UPF0339 family)